VQKKGTDWESQQAPPSIFTDEYRGQHNYNYYHYETSQELTDYFTLFPDQKSILSEAHSGSTCIVPFSFVLPKETLVSIPEVTRPGYFADNGDTRKDQEFIWRMIGHRDTLPIAHISIMAILIDKQDKGKEKDNNKKYSLVQPLKVYWSEEKWKKDLQELTNYNMIQNMDRDSAEFIDSELTFPEFVHVGDKVSFKVKIHSKLCRTLCNIEVRIVNQTEFVMRMVHANLSWTATVDQIIPEGHLKTTTDKATVVRSLIDLEVKEGETKEITLELTIPPACLPTLLPKMYPLMQTTNWVELSIQKGADNDHTYSGSQKFCRFEKPLIVLPEKPSKPPPTLDFTLKNVDPVTTKRLLTEVKVEVPKLLDEIPFMVPTPNGHAFVSLNHI